MKVVLVQVVDEDGEVPVDYSSGMRPEAFAAAVLSNVSTSLMELNPSDEDAPNLGPFGVRIFSGCDHPPV